MNFDSHHSALHKRRYPFLAAFDVTLNFLLSCGVFALGCAVLGVILTNTAPTFLARVLFLLTHIFN